MGGWVNGGRLEEVEEEVAAAAPVSPDASLADGLPLLGKIAPLLVGFPGRLHWLHGRALT